MEELKQETKQPTPNYRNYLVDYSKPNVGQVHMKISSRESKGGTCSTDIAACRSLKANYSDLERHARHEDTCSSPVGFGKLSINGDGGGGGSGD